MLCVMLCFITYIGFVVFHRFIVRGLNQIILRKSLGGGLEKHRRNIKLPQPEITRDIIRKASFIEMFVLTPYTSREFKRWN